MGLRKNQLKISCSNFFFFWAHFVQNFFLITLVVFILIYQVAAYAKIGKNFENWSKLGQLWTRISRNWDRNWKNPTYKSSAVFSSFRNSFRFDSIFHGVFRKVSFLRPSILTFPM